MAIQPQLPTDVLDTLFVSETLRNLPKADLHLHQEWFPRLDRVQARREDREPHDWRPWARRLMREIPPGNARLARLDSGLALVSRYFSPETAPNTAVSGPSFDTRPADFVARVEDLLEDGARDGAVLIEVRFGGETALMPDFMARFREAEHHVQEHYPALRAEAICSLLLWYDDERLERVFAACLRAAADGLSGLDFLYQPYDGEANWQVAYHLAARAVEVGLGITVHAGEFSPANIAAALRTPGVTRLGHAVYAAADPRLLDLIPTSGVTIECCLTSNVVLGAVPSYSEHPLRRFIAAGIPVTLATDNPVRVPTSIAREYALAQALGCSSADLLGFTANAVRASFASPQRKAALLAEVAGAFLTAE